MSTTDRCKYQKYRKKITSCKFILACASCDLKQIPRIMEKHLINQHVINEDNSCPWCLGEYIWQTKEKMHHWQHFENCYESYKKLYCTSDIQNFNNELQKIFWNKTVKECEVLFECPRCRKLILPRKMEDHFKKLHKELNVKKFCVFCNGLYEGKDVNHLTKCFDKQLILFSTNTATIREKEPPINLPDIIFDISPTCNEMDMFGRDKLPNLDERAYKHLFLHSFENIPDDENQIEFQGNIEIARKYISMYKNDKYIWYHIMVRAIAFNKFCEVLDKYHNEGGEFFILPFWCWCDCGKLKNPIYRHHRHMILATNSVLFMRKVWTKIANFQNNDKVSCKLSIRIKHPWHLVNTINYVSNQRSQCKFSVNDMKDYIHSCEEKELELILSNKNHYCIGTSLPKCFKLCMATVIENGYNQFFTERCGKYSVEPFIDRVSRENEKWVLLVKFLNDILKIREILPVAKIWKFDKHAKTGEAFIYTPDGNKLYFRKDESNLPEEEWIKMQIENGNVFLEAVEEEYWTPPPSQQKIISILKYFMEKHTKKVAEEMRHQIENLKSEENDRLKSEISVYREKMEKLQEEVINLRSKIENLKNEEIERLKSENKKLQEDYKKLLEDYKALLGASKFNAENMYLGQNINFNSDNPPKYNL